MSGARQQAGGARRGQGATALALAVLLAAGIAQASPRSVQLYSAGLIDFHAGRYQEALGQFEQAVGADPQDVAARYYRGVTYGRLGNYAAAEADLRAVAGQPGFEQATLELGIVLVRQERFAEAVEQLTAAQNNPSTFPEASLFLGIAEFRLGQLAAADAELERASRTAALFVVAQYYRGLVADRQQRFDAARDYFGAVVERSPESPMGEQAAIFLAQMGGQSARPWVAYGQVGFQYDSNVTLEPNDDSVAVGFPSNQSDGSSVLTAGFAYAPLRTENVELLIGYEFYQSLYFDLDQFNLTDQRPSLQLMVETGPVELGFAARYDYYLLDFESYFQGVSALPSVTVDEGELGRTQLYYRFRWRDYYLSPFRGVLDGTNHSPGILQQFLLRQGPGRYLNLGYRYDTQVPNGPDGDPFGYYGNEVVAGVSWAFPSISATSDVSFTYVNRSYKQASGGRQDDQYLVTVLLEKQLMEHLSLVGGYLGTFNNSNQALFDYNRNIVSLAVEVKY